MGSINFHSLLIDRTPLNSKQRHSEPSDHHQFLCLKKTQVPINLHSKKVSFSLLRTHSVASSTTSVVLGLSTSSSPVSGDLSVLLTLSVPLVLLYWITNFLLPSILTKDFSEEQQTEDENPLEDKFRQ
ncbi:hypothetical protein Scep_028795 [Stephania cephalantha]|uniref:Uncharacterized protein n=1 Tax=Stephania cephalantha TaxID=152367 RepID=A0AAP0HIG2_9MAGN